MAIVALPIQGTSGADLLVGTAGADFMYGGAGDDEMFGGEGNDNLRGGDGSDHLYGGEGNDLLNGDAGADVMQGGLGDDTYVVDDQWDAVLENGGEGYDTVKASVSYALSDNVEAVELIGSDNLYAYGNNLDNAMRGNSGNNRLEGYDGRDSLAGGGGDDDLVGGSGHDWLQGGAGADWFFLEGWQNTESASAGAKTLVSTSSDGITDFQHGVDSIVVQDYDFADVNTGVLDEMFFVAGASANAAHAQFIYDQAKKALYYDADGTGVGKAVKIADITNGAQVTASDIVVQSNGSSEPDFQQVILDFEDLTDGFSTVPTNYHGFALTSGAGDQFLSLSHDYIVAHNMQNSGYGQVTGTNVGFNSDGEYPIDIRQTNGQDFIFTGMDIASAWFAGQSVTLHGFDDGVEVYTLTVDVTPSGVHLAEMGWLIDDLQITSVVTDGSTGDRNGMGAHLAIDDINLLVPVFAVPLSIEPFG